MPTSTSHCRHYQGTHLPSLDLLLCLGTLSRHDSSFPGSYRLPSAISRSCSSNAFAAGAGQDIDPSTTFHVLAAPLSRQSSSRAASCPGDCFSQCLSYSQLLSPCPVALLPAGATVLPQFPHRQSAELGDPAGSTMSVHGLGTALPGAGHTWMAKPALPGSVCPHVTLDTPTGCFCLTSPHRDLTLPLWVRPLCCCQGPTGAPAPAQPPVGFPSSSQCKAEEMTSLLLPRQTRRLPNTQGLASPRLGHRSPSPPCSSPRQPIRGAAGEKEQGLWGGSQQSPHASPGTAS